MHVSSHTLTILKAKNAKGISWAALAESLGASDVWIAIHTPFRKPRTPSVSLLRVTSAFDFTMQIEKVPDPKGGRVVVHMNGKFLPSRRF